MCIHFIASVLKSRFIIDYGLHARILRLLSEIGRTSYPSSNRSSFSYSIDRNIAPGLKYKSWWGDVIASFQLLLQTDMSSRFCLATRGGDSVTTSSIAADLWCFQDLECLLDGSTLVYGQSQPLLLGLVLVWKYCLILLMVDPVEAFCCVASGHLWLVLWHKHMLI